MEPTHEAVSVSEMYSYPIKSCGRQKITGIACFTEQGFHHDRLAMVVGKMPDSEEWQFVAQRSVGPMGIAARALAEIDATFGDTGFIIRDSNVTMPPIYTAPGPDPSAKQFTAQLWSTNVQVIEVYTTASWWFTRFLNNNGVDGEFRLVKPVEPYDRKHGLIDGFPDRHPIHLITTASVLALSEYSGLAPEKIIERVRPNIVIDGVREPFVEETWNLVTMYGTTETPVSHIVTEPTERCAFVNLDQGILDPDRQPLAALAKMHRERGQSGKPTFGIHLRPTESGTMRVGDVVQPS